ncbi:ADP-ribosylglycohydrolase family protein [Streptomyces sp. ISL-22]|uniref:ADP-ribosylglycohydrolase family protein n=1 Tax=unclassified Streptomyces TaxID=2593676 RepID=UPI001BE59CA5|nr:MULTISPECIES: ADP-ribosylglycohydrolase family protein [unclassified Streptomyces]MBT2423021.1 ADP-ribosylglycohydrolase family protein [Streptomyces sp. ISL-24]MBT2435451.1 ADP-ribosylglycohydrolase family protein [Streptomyces sp. ISL-22]
MLRLTWVQPEDLLGHELRQAALDGREPSRIAERWRAAGGSEAPPRAGASPEPASRYLRQLAEDLLDELADLPSVLKDVEPTDLEKIKSLCPNWPSPPAGRGAAQPARYEAAWLGRAVGCLLGKPVEKLPLEAIRQLAEATGNWPLNTYFTAKGVPADLLTAHPWNRRSAGTSLAENIDGMPEDDDLNYPLLNLLLLRRHGKAFTTTDVARLWLDELPPGRTFTAERIAHRNLLLGIEPPHTARHRNPFREWIGALIRADVHGWTNPGDPAAAAEQAHRDATLTHTANGVYAAMFTAAVIARAATGTGPDAIHTCLRTGLKVIPPHSRLSHAVRHAIQLAETHEDFDTVVDELHATYSPAHHWVHAIPNTALITAALTHANGDFTGSVCRAVSGGWDTDSNGATAGSVAALLAGAPTALPDRWTAPLKNRLATSVADFNGTGFDTLARLTQELTHGPDHLEATRP